MDFRGDIFTDFVEWSSFVARCLTGSSSAGGAEGEVSREGPARCDAAVGLLGLCGAALLLVTSLCFRTSRKRNMAPSPPSPHTSPHTTPSPPTTSSTPTDHRQQSLVPHRSRSLKKNERKRLVQKQRSELLKGAKQKQLDELLKNMTDVKRHEIDEMAAQWGATPGDTPVEVCREQAEVGVEVGVEVTDGDEEMCVATPEEPQLTLIKFILKERELVNEEPVKLSEDNMGCGDTCGGDRCDDRCGGDRCGDRCGDRHHDEMEKCETTDEHTTCKDEQEENGTQQSQIKDDDSSVVTRSEHDAQESSSRTEGVTETTRVTHHPLEDTDLTQADDLWTETEGYEHGAGDTGDTDRTTPTHHDTPHHTPPPPPPPHTDHRKDGVGRGSTIASLRSRFRKTFGFDRKVKNKSRAE